MSALRIGIDATCWANGRGYGRFTRELCAAMVAEPGEHQFVFFADEAAAARFELKGDNVRLIVVRQSVSPTQAAAADGARSPFDMLRLSRAVSRERLDVFFSPSVYTYFPLPPRLRAVVTIHDAIAERYPKLTLPSTRARLFWKAKVKLALAQARLVLTVSDFSARELTQVLRVPRERLRVAVEAPPPSYSPSESPQAVTAAAARLGLPEGASWFVYVGGFNPHKHVDLAVAAHARLLAGRARPPYLLLVGTIDADVFHGDQGRIRERVRAEGSEALVRWTGFLPDAELRHLHSGSLGLLLPSECEGFGLPAVEAAACGSPVVATTNSPLPELLAGGGHFVEPGDVDALAQAMARLADDPEHHARLGAAALARARALTWSAAARSALGALEEAAA